LQLFRLIQVINTASQQLTTINAFMMATIKKM
jgi:hypothetical protein